MHHFWLYTWKLGYATSCVTFHSVSLFTIFKLKQRRHCSLSVLSYKGTHLSSRPAFSPVILLLLTHFKEPLLLSLTSFTRFNFRWALVFLVASLHVLTTLLYSRTQTPFPHSVDFFFPSVWVFPWAPSSSMWVSWHLCPISYSPGRASLGSSDVWMSNSSLGPTYLPALSSMGHIQVGLWRSHGSPEVQFLLCKILNSTVSRLLHPRVLPVFIHIPNQYFVRTGSHSVPLLVGSCTSCIRKLSSTHCRNLLDYMCLAALLLQKIPGWLKSPMRTGACHHEAIFSCVWEASSASSSWSGSW